MIMTNQIDSVMSMIDSPSVDVHIVEGDSCSRDKKKCLYSESRGDHYGRGQNQHNLLGGI